MKTRFFSKFDWAAFWIATLITFAVYFYTLGPSVGLEDSGELATAGAHLGVPHPPGYPFWTLCSWIFCKLFAGVTYMGHPTPAWAISLCSAVFGAFAAGCTAMLICRSAQDFVSTHTESSVSKWISFAGGIAGALTFAFSPVEWSQSTIVEIYSLNALFLMLVLLLSYRWMRKPSDKILWLTAFVFGLGLTNYQVLLFAIVPLAIIIALRNITLFRDFALYLIPVLLTWQVLQIGELPRAQFGMSKDALEKHAPVGFTDEQYADKLALENYAPQYRAYMTNPEKWRELRKDCTIQLAQGRTAYRMAKTDQERSEIEKALGRIAGTADLLDRIESSVQRLTPEQKKSFLEGEIDFAARTSHCPSGILVTLSIILIVGSLLAGLYMRTKSGFAKARKAVLYGGGAGSGLLLLATFLFSSDEIWDGITSVTAPLIEPSIYVAVGSFVALSAVLAVASGIAGDDTNERTLSKRLLVGSAISAALAIATVLVFVPPASNICLFGHPSYGYTGDAFPWNKSITVFIVMIAALFALSAFVKNGLRYAIPVAGFHIALFILMKNGAINGLVNPASWWFWWPVAWNFVVLALAWHVLPHGRSVAGAAFFTQLGVSFYAYMPIVSDLRNPPMNWGYPRTWEGFLHAITRGQYEQIKAETFASLYDLYKYLKVQMGQYFEDVWLQFTDVLVPFAIVPILVIIPQILHRVLKFFRMPNYKIGKTNFGVMDVLEKSGNVVRDKKTFWQWLVASGVCFLMMSVLLLILAKPVGDIQDGFIQKVKFIMSHAMIAMWIGYGLVFACIAAVRYIPSTYMKKAVLCIVAVVIAVATLPPIIQNYTNGELVLSLGGSEQNSHTFGWQFGAYQLDGAKAVTDQIEEDEEPLPDPDWPLPMEDHAFFFGGTDPGRFVPTYMIYSAQYRPDVYLITQNALADGTYMSVERDLYGDEIWIPAKEDNAAAFDEYVRSLSPEERLRDGITMENGRVQVTGAQSVMKINTLLTKKMFDMNKDRHAFYIEESYPIDWMYDYLTPHGLIMKIEPQKTTTNVIGTEWGRLIRRDSDFWDWYTRRLLDDPMYRRDFAAQKSFAKLRTAIAGLLFNRMINAYTTKDAAISVRAFRAATEQAFREAVMLSPISPESTLRYLQIHRFSRGANGDFRMPRSSINVIEDLIDFIDLKDPRNKRTAPYHKAVNVWRSIFKLEDALGDERMAKRPEILWPLARAYHALSRMDLFEGNVQYSILAGRESAKIISALLPTMSQPEELAFATRIFTDARMNDMAEDAAKKYLSMTRYGSDEVQLDLVKIYHRTDRTKRAAQVLSQLVRVNSAALKKALEEDDEIHAIHQALILNQGK